MIKTTLRLDDDLVNRVKDLRFKLKLKSDQLTWIALIYHGIKHIDSISETIKELREE